MDIERYLVILKGEDKTDKVEKVESANDCWRVNVTYFNPPKTYGYSKSNFEFYFNPSEINIDDNAKTLVQGDIFNVEKMLKFGPYVKIIFKDGSFKTVPIGDLKFTEKICEISEDRFKYFKEISKIVSVITEDGEALLTKEYEKVNFVEKDTALYKYLNSAQENKLKYVETAPLIFPFGSNLSQYEAVENALTNQVSVIEGPPGTGKTQTILNIIANILLRGKTVAVVSNNNEATANVYEKLEQKGLGFICATLGKKENKENFIANQTGILPNIEICDEMKFADIAKLNNTLKETFELNNEKAIAKEMLEEIRVQHKYFNENEKLTDIFKVKSILKLKSKKIIKLRVELEDIAQHRNKINFWFKLKAVLLYGIGDFKFYKLPISKIIKVFSKLYFITEEYELQNIINAANERLNDLQHNTLMDRLIRNSEEILKNYLKHKYGNSIKRKIYDIKDLYRIPDDFMRDYPVIFSTTYSIKECLNSTYKYDYIIMDEASQVDLITGTLALSCAKNAVIVGDRKQLPNVVNSHNKLEIEEINKKFEIQERYNYLKESFLTSVQKSVKNVPCVLLKEHYRCHPKIIQFSNKKFYDDQLIIMTEDKDEKDVMKAFITKEGNHARGHFNQRQLEVIKEEALPELTKVVTFDQIGIVSPYNDQKDGVLNLKLDDEIKVDTVHKYQGREKDAIIITTVDNEISTFVDDPKLLNVAVTRAKKYLRLIASKQIAEGNGNLSDLIKYIQYNNFELVESNIKSIYDLLYKANRKQRLEYLKGKKRIAEHDSENITYNTILQIIKKNDWNNLDVLTHVPLNELLKDIDKLPDQERKYASNNWTHIDLVIYNKMDKKLFIAVEVDGYHYHKKGTKQSDRDEMKNNILTKYNIPFIRLSTIGSGEEKRVEELIRKVFEENEMKEVW